MDLRRATTHAQMGTTVDRGQRQESAASQWPGASTTQNMITARAASRWATGAGPVTGRARGLKQSRTTTPVAKRVPMTRRTGRRNGESTPAHTLLVLCSICFRCSVGSCSCSSVPLTLRLLLRALLTPAYARSIRDCYFQCAPDQAPPLNAAQCQCGTPAPSLDGANMSLTRLARVQWASATFRLARWPALATTPAALRSR